MITADYVIREAEKSDVPAIVSFLHEHHFPEAVIAQAFFAKYRDRITQAEKQLMEETWKKFVSEAPSLVAIHKDTNDIAGAISLAPSDITKHHDDKADKPPGAKSKILQELDAIFEGIYAGVDMGSRFPEAKTMIKLRVMTVHRNHRGKGLAQALIGESVEWAKRHGFDLVHSSFSLPAAKKAVLSLGFVKIADYDLHTVKSEDGSYFFEDLSPNNVASVLALAVGK